MGWDEHTYRKENTEILGVRPFLAHSPWKGYSNESERYVGLGGVWYHTIDCDGF